MPKQTQKYRLGYYSKGDLTDAETEARRWITVDNQLTGLYEVLGNGIIEGWEITQDSSDPLGVSISAGKGVIGFVSSSSMNPTKLGPLVRGVANYLYVMMDSTTYWTKNVNFQAFVTTTEIDGSVYLGKVTTDDNRILSIDSTGRKNIGLVNTIQDMIKAHRHIGGTMPDQIDLSSDVQGTISQANLPKMDASIINTGVLDASRIPKIDHITGLTNNGSITHSQLDSFVQSLLGAGKKVMGETSLTNFLQLILSLKHMWPEVDEFLVNELSFIPGISPDSMIDTENTTATVDTRASMEGGTHTISGTAAPTRRLFTKTWDSETEFLDSESSGTVVDGDLVRLQPTEVKSFIEDFSSISDWKTEIVDLSSSSGVFSTDSTVVQEGVSSGKLDLNLELSSNIAFVMRKDFNSQDWSSYDRVVFYLNTKDIQHGDIFFFFEDAVAGSQKSYTAVLLNGEPTIDRETLEVGWREISVDISSMERGSVTAVGLYTSTNTGWDPSKSFSMNIDNMYLTTGNMFVDSGYSRFIYSSPIPQNFWRIRWDSLNPSGTLMKVRTRVSDTLDELAQDSEHPAQWSSYSTTSGSVIGNPSGGMHLNIQIEVLMQPSPDKHFSPELKRLYVDSYVSSEQQEFAYDDQDSWESGTNINIDTSTSPGDITVGGIEDAGTIFYGSGGKAIQVDGSMSPMYQAAGTALPRTTSQVMAGEPPGFGQTSAVCRGENGTIWVADTDNDRVVQMAKDGRLIKGFYGSFLSEPIDPYGTEETGPGSNVDVDSPVTPITYTGSPVPLHAVYNPVDHILSIVFDKPLETIHDAETTFAPEKLFLKASSNRVYFGSGTTFRLLGLDGAKYDAWNGSANKFIDQFSFDYHILQAILGQADYSVLNSIVDVAIPSITIASPEEQQMFDNTSVTVRFSVSGFTIGGDEGNSIRYQVDSGSYQFTSLTSVTLSGLSEGKHVVSASLVDGSGNPLENSEASVSGSFIVYLASYHNPLVTISSPVQGQRISSSPVAVAFSVINHPITPTGSYLVYSLDGEGPVAHRSYDAISISDVSRGEHTLTLTLVDEFGNSLTTGYHDASVTFFVGVSDLTDLRVSIDAGMISSKTRGDNDQVEESILDVDVADISFVNMYSPVDINLVTDATDSNGTVFVAKMRSPSWTYGMSMPTTGADGSVSVPPEDGGIFGTSYLDGHSVVGYNKDGSIVMTNNAAKFADTKANAKKFLGSVEYKGSGELLMADSIRNRAIITYTDLATGSTHVAWEYLSDRNVCDFHLVDQGEISITVTGATSSSSTTTVKRGETVIWRNGGVSPIRILSGATTPAQFNADPDLSLYGSDFDSGELLPGEQFAHTFGNIGDYNWFSYPDIAVGEVAVSEARISGRDKYLLLENDTSGFLFGSRVIKVDAWGNVIWSFGEGYLANPKDARPMQDEAVIIST
jgi:hypothetical protein